MLLWHYTHGANIIALVKSGVILSDVENVLPEDEKGPVWFSKNQEWEQTVKKTAIWKPDFPLMTFTELVKELGAYRIGVKPSTAPISYRELVKLRPSTAGLAKLGKEYGGNPRDWFVSLEPVPREKWVAVQVCKNFRWVGYDGSPPVFSPQVKLALAARECLIAA